MIKTIARVLLYIVSFILIIYLAGKIIPMTPNKERTIEVINSEKSVVIIDGCEYIEYNDRHNQYSLTHKGNCKNKIHEKHN